LSYHFSVPLIAKPPALHDRDRNWSALTDFAVGGRSTGIGSAVSAEGGAGGARLGLVYGRRRQGKTLMLELLVEQLGGLMFTGLPQAARQNLRRLAGAYAAYTGGPTPAFADWDEAVAALLRLGQRPGGSGLVVLDEFQYLVESEPALPSILQVALSPRSPAMRSGSTRLILCGSALSTMRGLLAGGAPLRGRAELEMMVYPFGFRDAAQFWGLTDRPDQAFRVHALVGGTPAYLAMCGGPPTSERDFARWVARGPLSPERAMFREGAVLLHEQPELGDATLYYSVLSAIAQGACRRSEIAGVLGRSDNSLSHPLAVLEQTHLIERVEDAFRQRRPVYRINEPAVRLYQLIIGPNEPRLVGGGGAAIWAEAADTVQSKIYGPHLEDLAREWCLLHSSTETVGGRASVVRSATLPCAEHRQGHELDVVVIQKRAQEPDVVIAIGEVKATRKPVDEAELTRLEHLRTLLPADRVAGPPRLLLFARAGFSRPLRTHAAGRADVGLIDLDRLYHGG
jgi:AAA+ ATPase superfamily predicted ATPase